MGFRNLQNSQAKKISFVCVCVYTHTHTYPHISLEVDEVFTLLMLPFYRNTLNCCNALTIYRLFKKVRVYFFEGQAII